MFLYNTLHLLNKKVIILFKTDHKLNDFGLFLIMKCEGASSFG